jgi:hypothetical protein
MAVLTHNNYRFNREPSAVEVRVKKYPLDADGYFDEYVKLEERHPRTMSQTRFLVIEERIPYAIEIVLRKGFSFEGYSVLRATLSYLGTVISIQDWSIPKGFDSYEPSFEDQILHLEANDPILNGKIMKGAKFVFETLSISQRYQISF